MPPATRKKSWNCKTCNIQKNQDDPALECDLCKEYVGLECTSYTTAAYKYLQKEKVEFNFICKDCKLTLPDLRNLLEITKQQQQFKEDLVNHDTRITKCEEEIEKIGEIKEDTKDIKDRLAELEAKMLDVKTVDHEAVKTIAKNLFTEADFPPMQEMKAVKSSQQQTHQCASKSKTR